MFILGLKSLFDKKTAPKEGTDNFDEEELDFNKAAPIHVLPQTSEAKSKWILKGKKQNYGPFTYEEILHFYEIGKIKDGHICTPLSGGKEVKVAELVSKKVS